MKKINKFKEKASKFDQNKEPLQLFPYESLKEIAKVLDFGTKKYGTNDWRQGIRYSRLIGAALRHIYQFNEGIDFDEETKTLHIANACASLIFLIWMYNHRKDLDDRYKNKVKS
jgi:hypothetical protein